VQLVSEAEAAVGVHGARRAHVAVEDPAEASEARRVEAGTGCAPRGRRQARA